MVLYPLPDCPPTERTSGTNKGSPISAWTAVEQKQKSAAKEWLLITQVDHAELAGDLAARLHSDIFPNLDADVIRAIALHDVGWAEFDAGSNGSDPALFPRLNERGKPLSFLEASPAEFVIAWSGSIAKAEQTGTAGGVIVSRHFCRLARARLDSRMDNEEDMSRLRQFVHQEQERQLRLLAETRDSSQDLDIATDTLQFCDLLSLYLCCGATEEVKFPQTFRGEAISVMRNGDVFHFQPAIFGSGVSLGVAARLYTADAAGPSRTLGFLLD